MGYKLKILSPVHIGCGEQYNAISYLLDKRKRPNIISVLDEQAIFKSLNTAQKDKFIKWIEKEQFPNLFKFLKDIIGDDEFKLSNQIQSKALYVIPSFAGDERLRDINVFIKQMHQPYIPGTEIKGAIRTAILYCALQEDEKKIQERLKQELESFGSKHGRDIKLVANKKNLKEDNPFKPRQKLSKLKETLEKQMHEISKHLQELFFNCKPDAKYDVMKFLHIGDSELLNAKTLAVSYAKPYKMSGTPFTLFYEYMQPDTNMSLSSFALESEKNRQIKLNKMGFSEGHKQLMSGLDSILTKCQRFAADLINEEIAYYRQHGKTDIVKHLEEIEKQNTLESPVLRIGKDEGYSSLTVGLAVKKLMPDLYENVLIHATKNKSYDSSVTHNDFYFPKSRKIVYWNGKELTAGWVKLIPPDTPSSPQQVTCRNEQALHKPNAKIDPTSLQALQAKFSWGR